MDSKTENKILALIALLVLAIVIVQASYNILQANNIANKGQKIKVQSNDLSSNAISGNAGYGDIARAEMCINIPPILTYDCNMTNATLNKSLAYNCTFSALDPNDDQIIYSIVWSTSPAIFNISSNGTVNFKPNKSIAEGINTFRIYLNDSSGCINSGIYREFNVSVVGENSAPYLTTEIPNQEVLKNQYFRFYLNDYFTDPDEDELSYFSILETGNTVRIKITENMVEIKGLTCGVSNAYFVANDPYGLTAQSNTITYNVTCSDISIANQNSNEDNSNSEGSGGGGVQTSCKADWRCNSWAPCQRGNFTYKQCVDYNGCTEKYERFLFQNCTYETYTTCNEKWDCTNWGVCNEGIHTRICMDLRNCGTNFTRPIESETCNKISTCYNNIKDGNETDVDCGGSCGACRVVEHPSKIDRFSTATIITIGLTIGLTFMIAIIFRDKLMQLYHRLFAKKAKKKKKIYINNKQKDNLIQSINIIQARLNEHKINHAIDEIAIFIKEYFRQLLTLDVFEKEELITKITKLNNKDLEKLLIIFYAQIINIVHLRNRGTNIPESEIQSLVDEMSYNIYLIAEFTDQDALLSVKDRKNNSKEIIDILYTKISNLYIALKFKEIIIAKNNYKEILTNYELLSEREKAIIYTDLIRAYESIRYIEKENIKLK
jgi:hypothetical protein